MMAARASAAAGAASEAVKSVRCCGGGGGDGGGGGCGCCRGWTPALGRRASDLALRLRAPTRALCGSLRAAIIVLAAIFTVLLLAEATIISNLGRGHIVVVFVDIAVAASNVGLIFGTMTGKLNYIYGWLSMALIDIGVAIATLIWLPIDIGYYVPYIFVFPLVHLWSQLLLVALVHGLAHDLRAGRANYAGNSGGGGGEGIDGWLQMNLAHAAPPLPGKASGKPRAPAVLEPSACTTAQPPMAPQLSMC